MNILIVSDSYKGSCSSIEVANSIEKGIKSVDKRIRINKLPIADGGEGTIDSIIQVTKGKIKYLDVLDPLGRKIKSKYGLLPGNEAIVEMAAASGLDLLEDTELNPLKTTTYGTGQLINAAIEDGAKRIYVGIGGSATNDGGVGMAKALGVSFKDESGKEIALGGEELIRIDKIDISNINKKIYDVEIIVISDVNNPLCGENGASYVYGPQKGARLEDIKKLDKALSHLADVIKRDLNKDIKNLKGAGAAGGLGGGLVAFCDASIKSGIEIMLDIINIDYYLKDTDLVITGEGRIDGQSIHGKVPVGVAKRSKKYNIPVVAIVGSMGEGAQKTYSHGIDQIVDIIDSPMTLDYAIEHASELIEKAAVNVMKSYINMEKVRKQNIKGD